MAKEKKTNSHRAVLVCTAKEKKTNRVPRRLGPIGTEQGHQGGYHAAGEDATRGVQPSERKYRFPHCTTREIPLHCIRLALRQRGNFGEAFCGWVCLCQAPQMALGKVGDGKNITTEQATHLASEVSSMPPGHPGMRQHCLECCVRNAAALPSLSRGCYPRVIHVGAHRYFGDRTWHLCLGDVGGARNKHVAQYLAPAPMSYAPKERQGTRGAAVKGTQITRDAASCRSIEPKPVCMPQSCQSFGACGTDKACVPTEGKVLPLLPCACVCRQTWGFVISCFWCL